MSGTTTQLNDGPGDVWAVTAPPGVIVTATNDPTTGLTTALDIKVDYSSADLNGAGQPNSTIPGSKIVELSFTGPVADPTGMPLIPGGQYPGLIVPTTIEITNDLNAPISGYTYNLIDNRVTLGSEPMDTSGQDAHPDDYAHFHNVADTSLINTADDTFNAAVSVVDPLGNPAAFGPPEANQALPAPSTIEGQGLIQPGATEQLFGLDSGGVTLHSEDTPGPDGGNFVMDIFPQSVVGTVTPSVLLTSNTDFAATDANDSFIFAGTSPTNPPTLNFLGGSSTINALEINGIVGVDATPNYGNINQQPGASVEVTGGLQISNGAMTDAFFQGDTLTLDGASTIDNTGTFALDTNQGTLMLDGTITVGSVGNNLLDVSEAQLHGGTIVQNGGLTKVGGNGVTDGIVQGTDFQVNGGALQIDDLTGFDGTIGSPGGGPAIGQFGEVNIFNIFDEQDITQASIDTTTGLMKLETSGGATFGILQFNSADDLSGIRLSSGSNGVLVVTDQPGTGFSPLPIQFTS